MDGTRGGVWEPFLTEQDRAHLALSRDRRVGFGRAPALVFIDLYRWVFGDQPRPLLEAIKTWPGSCGLAAWEAVPHLQRLLGVAREVGLPVVHITGLEDSGMLGWGEAAHGGAGRGPSTPSGGAGSLRHHSAGRAHPRAKWCSARRRPARSRARRSWPT